MNYHINTILIWDSFKKKSGCPFCGIEKEIEKQLIKRYLNEAVMQDSCRAEVNKYGFCSSHFTKLYKGENKLGLALQAHTRFMRLQKLFDCGCGHKDAATVAQSIENELANCLICRLIDFNISHYYTTIIKMYISGGEFRDLFCGCGGFCLKHFKNIIQNVKKPYTADKKEFISSIMQLQKSSMDKIEKDIRNFTESYNYINSDKQTQVNEDALKNCINTICGNIIE